MNNQNNAQFNEPTQSSKNVLAIVISVIITVLIVGGGAYAWQSNILKTTNHGLQQQIAILQNQIENLKSQKLPDDLAVQQTEKNEKKEINDKAAITNELPTISIIQENFSCEQNNAYAKFKILKNNIKVASVTVLNCDSKEGEILAVKNDGVYFSILPRGLGGYILYGKYTNLYKLNFVDNSVVKIKDQLFTDINVNSDLSMIVYSTRPNKITVKNLDDGGETTYIFSMILNNAQFGDFKFSPNQNKVAIAVGYGPDNERGEIHILNLENGTFELYKKTDAPPTIKGWLNNDEINWN